MQQQNPSSGSTDTLEWWTNLLAVDIETAHKKLFVANIFNTGGDHIHIDVMPNDDLIIAAKSTQLAASCIKRVTMLQQVSDVICSTDYRWGGVVVADDGRIFASSESTSVANGGIWQVKEDGSVDSVMLIPDSTCRPRQLIWVGGVRETLYFMCQYHHSSHYQKLYRLYLSEWTFGSGIQIPSTNMATVCSSVSYSTADINTHVCQAHSDTADAAAYRWDLLGFSEKFALWPDKSMLLTVNHDNHKIFSLSPEILQHSRCGACPSGATTPAGIDGYDDCVCGNNGEEVITTVDPPVCECGAGWNTQDDGTCDAICGVGDYPSTAQGTHTARDGAQSEWNFPQPLNGPGKQYTSYGYHWDATNNAITTAGDGSGTNGLWKNPTDVDFLDNSNALFLDAATRNTCIRKISLPSTAGADATFSRWAGICAGPNYIEATSLPIPSGSSLAYQNQRYLFGRDGVTAGGATPSGVLPYHPRALACTPDGSYCYVVYKHTTAHPQTWTNGQYWGGSTHPDTGSSSWHYSTAQIVRIRTSDRYITHLTKIHWRTGTTCSDDVLGCWLGYNSEYFGAQIHPISKKLIVGSYASRVIMELDVEKLIETCTTTGGFGDEAGCEEAEQNANKMAQVNDQITDIAITPNGRIFVATFYREIYALSQTSVPLHPLQGGGSVYSLTLVTAYSGVEFPHRMLPWDNNRLIFATQVGTYDSKTVWLDISDESQWPISKAFTTGRSTNPQPDLVFKWANSLAEMQTVYPDLSAWTSSLAHADLATGISPDHTFLVQIEAGYSSWKVRAIQATLGDHTYDYAVCADCPADMTAPAGSVDVTDCVNPCDANFYGTGNADCTACPANSESPEGTITIDGCLCKAGYAGSASDGCVACLYANDEYQPDAGQASCLTCDANASPTGDAAVACQCDPGYTGAADSCSACGEGSYKASPGAEACTGCPANTESSAASTSVNDCECQAGTEAPANGQACTECPVGEYKQATGAGDCIDCGTGATTLLPRSDDPSECVPDAGYTGSAGGPFTECGVGFYKSSAGTGACTTCYAHSTTSGTGSTSIDACSCVQPAYADDADGLHVCDCGAGYYWDGSSCVLCGADSFCVGGDTSTAVQTACSTVDPNSVSPAGSDAADDCVCDVGFKQGATCEACAAGSYSDQVDSVSWPAVVLTSTQPPPRLPHQPATWRRELTPK